MRNNKKISKKSSKLEIEGNNSESLSESNINNASHTIITSSMTEDKVNTPIKERKADTIKKNVSIKKSNKKSNRLLSLKRRIQIILIQKLKRYKLVK